MGFNGCAGIASRCRQLPHFAKPPRKNLQKSRYFSRLMRLLICGVGWSQAPQPPSPECLHEPGGLPSIHEERSGEYTVPRRLYFVRMQPRVTRHLRFGVGCLKGFDSRLVHQIFITGLDFPQVAEGRCGYAGSSKPISVERDSVRKEQLLEPHHSNSASVTCATTSSCPVVSPGASRVRPPGTVLATEPSRGNSSREGPVPLRCSPLLR